MNVFEEFRDIAELLHRIGARYVLVGGVAMAFHNQARFTRDIDLLVHPEDLPVLKGELNGIGYIESTDSWTFKGGKLSLFRFMKIQNEDHMQLDVLVANQTRALQVITNALEADSEYGSVRVAAREDLIWMKQQRNSAQDQVDIRSLKAKSDEENR